ncbi:MAG: S-layer homology domain-containing protein [Chloroflexota bacterium]|nr:S-layer homology domain-containing protein [Chloroflexota bacterium]
MKRKYLRAIFTTIPALLLGLLILTSTVYGATPGEDSKSAGTLGNETKSEATDPSAPSALGVQNYSASAYNSTNTEFLVVFMDLRNGTYDVYGQRVDADGTMLGTNFPIAVTGSAEMDPDIAYNSTANEYLVVWEEASEVYGQRVSNTGTLTGSAFMISDNDNSKDRAFVAYGAEDNQYLVVWEEYAGTQEYNVRGRRVSGTGTPQASVIDIASTGGSEMFPAVSYSPLTKEFLVSYRLTASDINSIKARRVTGTGAVQTGVINVSASEGAASRSKSAYNTTSNDWLVVWTDTRNGGVDIYAQLVDSSGSLVGSNYPLTTQESTQELPRIAYSSSASKYLAVWISYEAHTQGDIRAQVISVGGSPSGNSILVSTGPDRELVPAVSAGAGNTSFLVTFDDLRQEDSDVFGQRFNSNVALVGSNFPVAPMPYLINTPTPTRTATSVPTSTPTITSTPLVAPSATATACVVNYSDVPQSSTFYDFVSCLACRGVLSGYPDGTFRPGNNVTRAQLAKIVSNAAGFSETPDQQLFQDVPPGDTFYEVVYRLATNGAISGYPCGSTPTEPCVGPNNRPYFRPGNNATRGQIAKIVYEAADHIIGVPTAGGQTFEDVPPSSPFHQYIEALTQDGIMSGYECGTIAAEPCVGPGSRPYFRPSNNATRGQVAKIVNNTFFPNCENPAQ